MYVGIYHSQYQVSCVHHVCIYVIFKWFINKQASIHSQTHSIDYVINIDVWVGDVEQTGQSGIH